MGFRFRKSFKIAPGVRVNIRKKSVGISAGVKGARVSVNSNGRVTKSVGIPGTGLSYVSTSKIGGEPDPTNETTGSETSAVNLAPPPNRPPSSQKWTGKSVKILSVVLIVMGLILSVATIIGGFLFTALGCVGLQYRAKLLEQEAGLVPVAPYKRKWQIVVIALFVFFSVSGVLTPDPISEIKVDGLYHSQLKVPEAEEIVFSYSPADSSTKDIACTSSDNSLATVSVAEIENGKIKCIVTPISAGNVTIWCESNSVKSPELALTITDPAAEEAARKAAEEAAAAQAETERKAAEEAAAAQAEAERKAAEEAAAAQTEAERKAAEEAAAAATQQNTQTVYITPSGKRYHLSATCGGKNSRPVDISEVGSRTPCKKCAGG